MLAKRLLGKLKKKPKEASTQHKPPQQRQPEDSEDYGSEYTDTDDERVHDFEIGQENYLLQVALATSAPFQSPSFGSSTPGAASSFQSDPGPYTV